EIEGGEVDIGCLLLCWRRDVRVRSHEGPEGQIRDDRAYVAVDVEAQVRPFGFEDVAVAVVVATGVDGAIKADQPGLSCLVESGVCHRERERSLAGAGSVGPGRTVGDGGGAVGD